MEIDPNVEALAQNAVDAIVSRTDRAADRLAAAKRVAERFGFTVTDEIGAAALVETVDPSIVYFDGKIERLEAKLDEEDGLRARRLVASELAQTRAARRRAIVESYPCRDCGAVVGVECTPGYGCEDSDRLPLDNANPLHARAE